MFWDLNFTHKMLSRITTKTLLIFLLASSVAALIAAYISQFGFDLQPCILCLYQRKPFFATIALSALALVFFKSDLAKKIALFCCIIFLTINVAIAAYHTGVEKKIFKGPTTCSSENLNDIENLEDLKTALSHTKAIRCDQPSFVFLDLSMATWNLIYCAILVLITAFFLRIGYRK